MTPTDRLAAIDKLIQQFESSLTGAESSLMDRLAGTAKRLLADPSYLATVLRDWHPEWVGLIQQLVSGILSISELNRLYFDALGIAPAILSQSGQDLLAAIGLTSAGILLEGGYLSTIVNDTTVGRGIVSLLTDAKLRKLNESALIGRLKPLIRGKSGSGGSGGGILSRLFDSLETQPYVEADRVMQRVVAVRADLRASLYLGGLIDGSRPFCAVRNGKVFLVEEIEKFGTSADTYGGYADKKTGFFSGKPKSGYDPFTQCGGYGCRHGWNYISNGEALKRRDDLEEVKGVLRIKKE